MKDKGKIKILIVDDHPVVRQGLKELFQQENDLIVCAETEEAPEAVSLVKLHKPDLAIVDISIKAGNGLELIKDIKAVYPRVAILVLSMHDESLYAERALRAGASAYLMKHEAPEKIVGALRRIREGKKVLSEYMAEKMIHKATSREKDAGEPLLSCLSNRELEVFQLIGEGSATREIAEKLHLSVKTVETYRAHIKEKLHLKNATELLQTAVCWVEKQE